MDEDNLDQRRSQPDCFSNNKTPDTAANDSAVTGPDQVPPSPFDVPGICLIETKLGTGLVGGFGAIATPEAAASILFQLIGEADCEHFAALFLNARHQLTHAHIVSRGTTQSALVHPREVFKAAVLASAAAIVVGHNHPSGNVHPSAEDKAVGQRVESSGELLGIPVLDSLIVGPSRQFYAASTGRTQAILPESPGPSRQVAWPESSELGATCRGLLRDIDEVIERQGEAWWDETVTAGIYHRSQAEKRLGLSPYQPVKDRLPGTSEPP